MTNPERTTTDTRERLSGVREQLDDAVQDLIGVRHGTITVDTPGGGTTIRAVYRDSVYTEMVAALPGGQGTQLGSTARSMPPLWVDGLIWLNEVHATIDVWVHTYQLGTDLTVTEQLDALTALTWRPQDVPLVQDHADSIRRWVRNGTTLIDGEEQRKMELVSPCPACGVRTVYRKDSGGDTVRQAALSLTTTGCVCLACRHDWAPQYFQHLAAVLGCNIPGVA